VKITKAKDSIQSNLY